MQRERGSEQTFWLLLDLDQSNQINVFVDGHVENFPRDIGKGVVVNGVVSKVLFPIVVSREFNLMQ